MPINRGKAEVKGIEAEGMCLLSDDWLTRIASSVAGRVPGFSSFGQSSAYRCRSQRPNCRRLWRPAERRPRANCNRARRRRRQVDLQGHRKPKAAGMEPALAQEVGRGGAILMNWPQLCFRQLLPFWTRDAGREGRKALTRQYGLFLQDISPLDKRSWQGECGLPLQFWVGELISTPALKWGGIAGYPLSNHLSPGPNTECRDT